MTVPTSSCVKGLCTEIFHVTSLFCLPLPNGINITVAGQNVLGKGTDSYPITVSSKLHVSVILILLCNNYVNNIVLKTTAEIIRFVNVDIMQASNRVACTFHYQQIGVNKKKTCSIAYGPMGSNCKTINQSSHSFSDSVVIGLPLEDIKQDYCFSITASNGFLTAIVEGTFKKGINLAITL